jgi:hypothetical protein
MRISTASGKALEGEIRAYQGMMKFALIRSNRALKRAVEVGPDSWRMGVRQDGDGESSQLCLVKTADHADGVVKVKRLSA